MNNLASLYSKVQELEKSEVYYEEALKIRRELAKNNPNAFLPDIAGILNNLGLLRNKMQELEKAEVNYVEALGIL